MHTHTRLDYMVIPEAGMQKEDSSKYGGMIVVQFQKLELGRGGYGIFVCFFFCYIRPFFEMTCELNQNDCIRSGQVVMVTHSQVESGGSDGSDLLFDLQLMLNGWSTSLLPGKFP